MSKTPIVIIGRAHEIATAVKEELLPDYDVIHIMLSEEQALADLPLLLSNPPKQPPNSNNNYGSQRYDVEKVVAVLAGGGFNDEQFQMVKEAVKHIEDKVIWARTDISKIDTMPPPTDRQAYGKETGRRVKKKLDTLRGEGVTSGVHFFT